MKTEEIFEEWAVDSKLDRTELGKEALDIPKLHNKYYKIYIAEKYRLMQLEADLKKTVALRHDFYSGSIDDDTLEEMGWLQEFRELGRKTILKSDIPRYLDADDVIINKTLKVGMQKEKVLFVDSIIKSLVNRGFNIKAAIDFARFQSGA